MIAGRNLILFILIGLLLPGVTGRAETAEKKKIAVLVGRTTSTGLIKAARKLRELPKVAKAAEIKVYFIEEFTRFKNPPEFLRQADVIVFDAKYRLWPQLLKKHLDNRKAVCYELRGRMKLAPNSRKDKLLVEYYSVPSPENMENLLRYLINRECGLKLVCGAPKIIPPVGIFHPQSPGVFTTFADYLKWYKQSGRYRKGAPWAGLNEYLSMAAPGCRCDAADAIVRTLERSGLNVMTVYSMPHSDAIKRYFFGPDGKPRIDIFVPLAFGVGAASPKYYKLLAKLKCPVIDAVRMFDMLDDWKKSNKGLSTKDLLRFVCVAERNGLVDLTIVGGKREERDARGWMIGAKYVPCDEGVEILGKRVNAWLKLRTVPNRDKKIVIMYYNHPGKQNVGASYLNVFASLTNMLKRLKAEGYSIKGEIPEPEHMKELVIKSGINIGSYAPGELGNLIANSPGLAKVKISEYRKWYSQLPENFRKNVEKGWGRPEDCKIMTRDGAFMLPVLDFGNVALMPQPSRGWSTDPGKLYHSDAVYPHHQYISAYYWLREKFHADALFYLGRHGTLEWLPGKQGGLSQECPPEVLGGPVPVFYPYIVDGIGEGLVAKRRGRGVIISHLTPVFTKAGLYAEHLKLSEQLNAYQRNLTLAPRIAAENLKTIRKLAGKLGYKPDSSGDTEKWLETLEDELDNLKNSSIPYGLHSFGKCPTGKEEREFAAMIREGNPEIPLKTIRSNLARTADELNNMVAGLNSRFIPVTCGYDPVRDAKVLPTGRNFHGIDLDRIPSKAAFAVGRKVAEDLIDGYRNKHNGRYPEKIGMVLWCGEAQRTEGSMTAAAMYLMGMVPDWNRRGQITGVKPVPGAILKRPRIDVHIQVSGLYRDTLPHLLDLLDDSARQAALLKDTENFISKHNNRIKRELKESGVPEKEAELLSGQRVFSAAPGAYGTRIANLATASGVWDKDSELGEAYISNVSCAYGRHFKGKQMAGLYRKSLADVEIAIHSRSSNLYQTLDIDDVFQYLGGLSAAVKCVKGKAPEVMLSHQEKPGHDYLEPASRTIAKELRARNFNPKWVTGMMQDKYAGAREIADQMENLWGWQTTVTESVTPEQWNQAYETYVKDKHKLGLKQFFNRHNPWAEQSITARMLETARKNYWDMPEAIRQDLAKHYAKSVISNGVSCCDHTCNNPFLNQMVVNLISMPGVMPLEQIEKFKLAINRAAGKPLEQAAAERKQLRQKLNDAAEQRKRQETEKLKTAVKKPDKKLKGYEIEQDKSEEKNSFASSGLIWQAVIAILAVMAVFIWGIARKR